MNTPRQVARVMLGLGLGLTAMTVVAGPTAASQEHDYPSNKVFVCKYVGTPGTDERLQTGDNPISVSVNAIPVDPVYVGAEFSDQHGRSIVIAFDTGQPEPVANEACPLPDVSTTTTTSTSTTSTTIPETTTTTVVDRCEEDEPCWDCNTMGNQVCGSATSIVRELPAPTTSTSSVELARTGNSHKIPYLLFASAILIGYGIVLMRKARSFR